MNERRAFEVQARITANITVEVYARTPEEASIIAEEQIHDDLDGPEGLQVLREHLEDVTIEDAIPVDGLSSDESYPDRKFITHS